MKRWLLFFAGIIVLTFGSRVLLLSQIGVGGLDAVAISPIITALIIGKCYDLWGELLFNGLASPQTQGGRGLIYLIGLLIAPIGAALYIISNLSLGPVDYLMRSIEKHYSISMQKSRLAIEGAFVMIGYLVGGPIGMGTVGIMLFWGPILQAYYEGLTKWIKQ